MDLHRQRSRLHIFCAIVGATQHNQCQSSYAYMAPHPLCDCHKCSPCFEIKQNGTGLSRCALESGMLRAGVEVLHPAHLLYSLAFVTTLSVLGASATKLNASSLNA